MKKVLIIRFSSIGDIVLTTPVVRAIKEQLEDVEISYLTKESFKSVISENPHVSKVFTIKEKVEEVLDLLREENFDYVVDLHKNIRSKKVRKVLSVDFGDFPKLNIQKYLLTKFKVNKMPDIHIVDRYFESVKDLGIKNDGKGLDHFIPSETKVEGLPVSFHAFVIGGSFATKRMPAELIKEVIDGSELPVVLLGGGKEDEESAEIISKSEKAIDLVNKISLAESAFVVKNALKVISHDTGLMHVAAAYKKEIISIWGNTVPDFGMYPYKVEKSHVFENKNLGCRPCSKLGYGECPKKHFKCMREIDVSSILKTINNNETFY